MTDVIVKNSRFISHYPVDIAKNTVNAEAVLVRLDPEWEGLTVRIHWLNVASGVEKVVPLERDQPNTIPWEVLTDLGELRMGLVGLDGETVIKPTIWLTYGYVADGVDPEAGSDPQPPTPSWEQQMVALAEAAANAAKAAKETADNLQAAAEAGEFNGDPGPEGPPGKSPIIRNGTWWIWNNDSQDYTDTGVVASGGGGGGVTSYNDLSDRPSIGGILLEGNKTAQDLGLQPKGNYATTSSKLANPFFITFTGAVEATYDGSQAVTVTIPTIAGPTGATPNIQIGTVETLDPGSDATATITGTPESPRLNLGIPRGQNGKTPVKGTDYFTDDEIQDVAEKAAALVLGGGSDWELYKIITLDQNISAIEEDFGFDASAIKIVGLCSTTVAANYTATIKGSGGVHGYKSAVINGNSSTGSKDRISVIIESSGIDSNDILTIAECKRNDTSGNSYFGYFSPRFPATGIIISMSNQSSEFVSGSIFRIEVKR